MAKRKRELDPHTKDDRSPLELVAMMLVSGGYRIPVAGRGTKAPLNGQDVAGALGMVKGRLKKQVAVTVVKRGDQREVAKIVRLAYRRVLHRLLLMENWHLDLRKPADRWRLRIVIFDAAYEMVWPEKRQRWDVLAKQAKMRRSAYVRVHKLATAVLQESLAEVSVELGRKLFSNG